MSLSSLLDKAFSKSKNPKELTFLNEVFKCIDRKNPKFLSQPGVSKQILSVVHKHINDAKNKEIERQKKKVNTNTNNKNNINTNTKNDESDEKDKSEKVTSTNNNNSKNISTTTDNTTNNNNNINDNKNEKSDDEKPPPPLGNGGKTDKYVWTQTLKEVDVHFEVPANLRGKHFIVEIKASHLKVGIKGSKDFIVNGELDAEVIADDCAWTLDKEKYKDTKTLSINLQKKNGMSWWKRVIVGDPCIDTKTIEPENSKLDDLDPETRQTVAKMMFDQRQKMMGKPTSKELEQRKILEKFKLQHPEMNFDNVKFG